MRCLSFQVICAVIAMIVAPRAARAEAPSVSGGRHRALAALGVGLTAPLLDIDGHWPNVTPLVGLGSDTRTA
jgi:hypothetical protein